MLMKVVLPAPLVPIRPTTESFSIAALTSAAAVTAPKVLHKPCASRMAGTAAQFSDEGKKAFGEKKDQKQQRGAEAHLPPVGGEGGRHGVDRALDQRADEQREHRARAPDDSDVD